MNPRPKFAFFGTIPLAEAVLTALEKAGYVPSLIVAGADTLDRKKRIIPPIEKQWAESRGIPVVQPRNMSPEFVASLAEQEWDFFVVASYGKILPKALLDIPKRGTVNMHPSLLPKLRGPSPIRSAILTDQRDTGVSVMILDDTMDHGPLIGQKKIAMPEWPMRGKALDELLAHEGAMLLVDVLPKWLRGDIEPEEQNHAQATYCKIFLKEEGELDLSGDAYQNLLKIRAFEGWPGTFAFFERGGEPFRVRIVDAHLEGSKLIIDTVKPEGKGEMPYADFVRSGATLARS